MNQSESLFQLLETRAPEYSSHQKSLAKFVMKNYQRVAFTTIRQLAELAGVSEATIVRFVKVLGFKGYPAFQREIRGLVRADLKGQERFKIAYESRPKESQQITRIIRQEMENLSHLQETFSSKEFAKVISAIRKAEEVLVVGTRSTASLAHHLWFGLTKLDIRAVRVTSIITETFDYVNKLDRHSLIILIGFPRYLAGLLNLLHFAQKRGLRTVTITDGPFSRLQGEMNLYAPTESVSFVAFHCAPLVLINAIIDQLARVDKEKTLRALNRFETLAEDRNYFVKA
jgi:DNA-binding MurR/RpiR family transcriptional regulator